MKNTLFTLLGSLFIFPFVFSLARAQDIEYGLHKIDPTRVVAPNTQAFIDTDTNHLYLFQNSMSGYDLIKVPSVKGKWDESKGKKLLDLGKRTIWYTHYDSASKSAYMITDEKNDEGYDVFRLYLQGKVRLEKVTKTGYTFGYDVNAHDKSIVYVSHRKSSTLNTMCLEEIKQDGQKNVAYLCDEIPGANVKVFNFFIPKVSQNGRYIVFGTRSLVTNDNGYAVYDKLTKKIYNIYKPNTLNPTWASQALGWQGDSFFVISPTGDSTKGLYKWDATKPEEKMVVVTPEAQNISQGFKSKTSQKGILLVTESGKSKVIEYDFAKLVQTAASEVPTGISLGLDFVVPMPVQLSANSYALAYASSENPYGGVGILNKSGADLKFNVGFKTKLIDTLYPACKAKTLKYNSVTSDGKTLEIDGVLYISEKPLVGNNTSRAIVYTHGGPSSHNTNSPDYGPSYLCKLGYPVFAPNVRGSDHRGNEFQDMNNGDWGGKDLEDYINGREFISKELNIPVDRIGYMGWSYGGFMALSLLTSTKTKIPYAIEIAGFADMLLMLKADQGVDTMMIGEMGDPSSSPQVTALYKERSPSENVQNITAPLLVIQGTQDPRVPWETTKPMIEDMKSRGMRVDVTLLKGEGHLFGNYPTLVETYMSFSKFLFEMAPLE